jgi:ABC-type nitrate/sulfonate/bicarbonate transport system substrate-binding protein
MRVPRQVLLQRRIVVLLLLSLALTGCQRESQKAIKPAVKITLAYATATSGVLAHIALKNGYFADEGLKVTAQSHSSGKSALNAVIEGKADFATVAETPIMFAIVNGKKISIIAEIQTSAKNEAIVAKNDLNLTRVSDLRGKKIGVTIGTTGDYFLDSILLMHGVDRKEVNIIDMKPEEMLDYLSQGKVDAVSTWNPIQKYLTKQLGDRVIVFNDDNIYTEFFCIAAKKDFTENNPEAVVNLLKALLKAEIFVEQYPEKSKIIVAEYAKTDQDIVNDIWINIKLQVKLDQLLLVTLDDQTRWAKKYRLTDSTEMPNYLDFIYLKGLQSVKPEAVTIIR